VTEPDPGVSPAVLRSREELEDLYDHAPCGYLATLPDGLIVDVNQTFLAWTGHRREDLVGARRFAELLTPGGRAFHTMHYLPALERTQEIREVAAEITCADGQALSVMLSSTMRRDADGRVGLIRTTLTDATMGRRYERELRQAHDREREARERGEQLVAELRRRAEQHAAITEVGRLALGDAGHAEVVQAAVAAIARVVGAATVRMLTTGEEGATGRAMSEATVAVTVGDPAHSGLRLAIDLGGADLAAEDRDFVESVATVVWLALERRRQDERHRHLALHDPLTGLPNRLLLADRLDGAVSRARRRGTLIAVMVLDLDGFKQVNDSAGHHAGDEVLQVLAARFAAALRGADTVGRLGGDEFAVICEDVSGEQHAAELARRVVAATAQPIPVDGVALRVGVSVGTVVRDGDTTPEEIMRDADRAMYAVKAPGRARR
jgi:diguanylate cyclase (GGDEF)-like protein/PAS domain S-box-containing protein